MAGEPRNIFPDTAYLSLELKGLSEIVPTFETVFMLVPPIRRAVYASCRRRAVGPIVPGNACTMPPSTFATVKVFIQYNSHTFAECVPLVNLYGY